MSTRNRNWVGPKTMAAVAWAKEHPDATQSAAVQAGFTKSTFYHAQRYLRQRAPQDARTALVPAPRPALAPPLLSDRALRELVARIRELSDLIGVVELHYKDGKLEVLRREIL